MGNSKSRKAAQKQQPEPAPLLDQSPFANNNNNLEFIEDQQPPFGQNTPQSNRNSAKDDDSSSSSSSASTNSHDESRAKSMNASMNSRKGVKSSNPRHKSSSNNVDRNKIFSQEMGNSRGQSAKLYNSLPDPFYTSSISAAPAQNVTNSQEISKNLVHHSKNETNEQRHASMMSAARVGSVDVALSKASARIGNLGTELNAVGNVSVADDKSMNDKDRAGKHMSSKKKHKHHKHESTKNNHLSTKKERHESSKMSKHGSTKMKEGHGSTKHDKHQSTKMQRKAERAERREKEKEEKEREVKSLFPSNDETNRVESTRISSGKGEQNIRSSQPVSMATSPTQNNSTQDQNEEHQQNGMQNQQPQQQEEAYEEPKKRRLSAVLYDMLPGHRKHTEGMSQVHEGLGAKLFNRLSAGSSTSNSLNVDENSGEKKKKGKKHLSARVSASMKEGIDSIKAILGTKEEAEQNNPGGRLNRTASSASKNEHRYDDLGAPVDRRTSANEVPNIEEIPSTKRRKKKKNKMRKNSNQPGNRDTLDVLELEVDQMNPVIGRAKSRGRNGVEVPSVLLSVSDLPGSIRDQIEQAAENADDDDLSDFSYEEKDTKPVASKKKSSPSAKKPKKNGKDKDGLKKIDVKHSSTNKVKSPYSQTKSANNSSPPVSPIMAESLGSPGSVMSKVEEMPLSPLPKSARHKSKNRNDKKSQSSTKKHHKHKHTSSKRNAVNGSSPSINPPAHVSSGDDTAGLKSPISKLEGLQKEENDDRSTLFRIFDERNKKLEAGAVGNAADAAKRLNF